MTITRELRTYVLMNKDMWGMNRCAENIARIADRIDAEHKRLTDKAHADGERSAMKQVRSRSVDYKKGYEQAMKDVEERTKTEQNGVSITDELRECIRTAVWQYENGVKTAYIPKDKLAYIAERIDEQVSKMYADLTIGMEPMTDDSMAEHGWIRLPVDADGVPIRLGDEMEWSNGSFTVHELKLTEDGWQTWDSEHGYTVHADECIRHHQHDSWERIIEDAMSAYLDDDSPAEPTKEELVERCRRLAGDES